MAPTGARRTKADHPALPLTAEEIAAEAAASHEAGAAMIHMHVRDSQARHTLDLDAYRAATAAVRREVGDRLIVQVTAEAAGLYAPSQQMAMVRELKPEAVSLVVRELLPEGGDEKEAAGFLGWLRGERIMPQYVLFDADELRRLHDLRRRGVVPGERVFALLVLGRYIEGQVASPPDLLPYLEAGTQDLDWAICAFGPREGACALGAAVLGGHARVGFENNFCLADGSTAGGSAALVAQLCGEVARLGRPLADAATARAMLGA